MFLRYSGGLNFYFIRLGMVGDVFTYKGKIKK